MIDLYSFPTPNGRKISIMLEETGLEYRAHLIDINKGEQFGAEFLEISPNGRIPAIIDQDGPGGNPFGLFESGAILIYLAEKAGMFMPTDVIGKYQVIEWVMWQMGGVGPMFGQAFHFLNADADASSKEYGTTRYVTESNRLADVMNGVLATREYIAGDDYSIADMAIYPWMMAHAPLGIDLETRPDLKRWFDAVAGRPAIERALNVPPRPEG